MKKILILFPLVLALVLCGPYQQKDADSYALAIPTTALMQVASALVVGGAMYYCYSHGGKELWSKLSSATKDGVDMTKDWFTDKIAEMYGIDTSSTKYGNSPSSQEVPPPVDNIAWINGAAYSLTRIGSGVVFYASETSELYEFYDNSPSPFYYWRLVNGNLRLFHVVSGYWEYGMYAVYSDNDYATTPCDNTLYNGDKPGFSVTNYPQYFASGDVLNNNAYKVMTQGNPPVLDWGDLSAPPTVDPTVDQVKHINVSAGTAAGDAVLDDDKAYFPAPPAVFAPGGLGAPVLDPSSVGGNTVSGATGSVPINSELDKALNDAGVKDGKITSVKNNTVTWVDSDGVTHVSVVTPEIAKALAPAVAASGAVSVPAALTDAETITIDATGFDDPGLPDVPIFDPTYDMPVKNSTQSFMSRIIEMVPGVDILTGSAVESSGTSSMLLPNPLGGEDMLLDFGPYAGGLAILGDFLFGFCCLGSIVTVVRG